MKKLLLSENEIEPFLPSNGNQLKNGKTENNFGGRVTALLEHQKSNWELLKNNLESLSASVHAAFTIDGAEIIVQNNPQRIQSTTAKVDEDSINNRKCFLCEERLLPGQRAIRYYKDYNILCNPYPIINEHLTIAKTEHIPQTIHEHLNDMLLLSRDLGDKFAVFYNGPKCGASAPDHLHFQAVAKNALPIYAQLINGKIIHSERIISTKKIDIYTASHAYRYFIKLVSNNAVEILNIFSVIYKNMQLLSGSKDEPMMNIVSFYEEKKWNLLIIPRRKHRPVYYFKTNDEQILISPASIDICGLLVAPRIDDLEKVTTDVIKNIFKEVCITKEFMEYLKTRIISFYK